MSNSKNSLRIVRNKTPFGTIKEEIIPNTASNPKLANRKSQPYTRKTSNISNNVNNKKESKPPKKNNYESRAKKQEGFFKSTKTHL